MDLIVQKRSVFGKSVKSLRKQGLIPAELYGHGLANIHLSIPVKDFRKVLKTAGENTLINVVVEKDAPRPALIYNVQTDSLTDEFLQVDLYQVRMDQAIKTKVPLEFVGESMAVKSGGVLVKSMQEIEVEALPVHLPRKIEVTISKIEAIGQSIYVKDLNVASEVKLSVPGETVVATVVEKVTEAEELALAAEGKKVEEVAVETEEKKAERVAKKEAEGVKPGEEKKPEKPEAKK